MNDNFVSKQDEVQHALQVLQEHGLQRRGDSFDIGGEQAIGEPHYLEILQNLENPGQLAQVLNLNEKQVQNLKSLIVGGGTGGIHRLLSKNLGDIPSALIGSVLSAWIAGKIINK